jgi:DDE superfamily endonuclease
VCSAERYRRGRYGCKRPPSGSTPASQAATFVASASTVSVWCGLCRPLLALLWQILSGIGFPNHFFCDSWVVGFWRGRPWLAGRWIGKTSLDVGSSRFWIGWVTRARRQMCPLYVSGLIGPGDRKSVQPMAKRLALGACDQLHHFIAAGVWDAVPVETELLVQTDRLVGGSDAALVIDDCGSGTRASSICPEKRLGLLANTGCRERRNITSPTCRRRLSCVSWRPPSRRDGFASKLISN